MWFNVGVKNAIAIYVINIHNHMDFKNNCTHNSQITLGFASYSYLKVTGRIILELYSNACGYLY